jgi:hypothetical protein
MPEFGKRKLKFFIAARLQRKQRQSDPLGAAKRSCPQEGEAVYIGQTKKLTGVYPAGGPKLRQCAERIKAFPIKPASGRVHKRPACTTLLRGIKGYGGYKRQKTAAHCRFGHIFKFYEKKSRFFSAIVVIFVRGLYFLYCWKKAGSCWRLFRLSENETAPEYKAVPGRFLFFRSVPAQYSTGSIFPPDGSSRNQTGG